MQVSCGLVKSAPYTVHARDYANENAVTSLSFMTICCSDSDRSRSCQQSSPWDVTVMNLSTPGTGMFGVSWWQGWQLVAPTQHHVEIFIPARFKRQGWVSQSALRHCTWKLSNFILVQRSLIFSPSLQIIMQLLHLSQLSLATCIRIIAPERKDFIAAVIATLCPKLTWKQSKYNSNFPIMAQVV